MEILTRRSYRRYTAHRVIFPRSPGVHKDVGYSACGMVGTDGFWGCVTKSSGECKVCSKVGWYIDVGWHDISIEKYSHDIHLFGHQAFGSCGRYLGHISRIKSKIKNQHCTECLSKSSYQPERSYEHIGPSWKSVGHRQIAHFGILEPTTEIFHSVCGYSAPITDFYTTKSSHRACNRCATHIR